MTRVIFSCTGVGIYNRGIESFFREVFDGVAKQPGLDSLLLKGAGADCDGEKRVFCLPRTGCAARVLGRILRRNAYVAEQLTSFPSVVRQIRRFRPEVIFYSDANLGYQLYRWRRRIGVPYKLLFSNGGPIHAPFVRMDYVHQVAPYYQDEALRAGEPASKHHFVPYGISERPQPAYSREMKHRLRCRLGLPIDIPIVLSVGWIARQHKRMDYLINELAAMPEPRPHLLMLGAMDEATPEVLALAERTLGPAGFTARSVPYAEVSDYYGAADVFVLCSLQEGFGRVYLEALMHGLPTIGHAHPVIEYVLGQDGIIRDLSRPGGLQPIIPGLLAQPSSEAEAVRRWQGVCNRFSWNLLAPRYRDMFSLVAGSGFY